MSDPRSRSHVKGTGPDRVPRMQLITSGISEVIIALSRTKLPDVDKS